MNETAALSYTSFALPPTMVSRVDISRLTSELEQIDNELTAIGVRAGVGAQAQANPVLSQQLTDFLVLNKLTLKTAKERSEIIKQVRLLKDHAPTIHMTFAVTVDPESLGQLAQWLRRSIHPQAMISVGLQPALVAGVYLRTANKVYDLSLRAALKSGRSILKQDLEALRAGR